MLDSDFAWSPVVEPRMETFSIVEDLDVPRNVVACFLACRVDGTVDAFVLQGAEE